MCLALPSRVIKIKGKFAWIQSGNHRHKVNLSLVKNVKVGDFLLAHEHLALNKIPKSEAKKIVRMIEEVNPPKFCKAKLGRASEPHK